MRVIEKQMLSAVHYMRAWRNDNTEVKPANHAGLQVAEVFLHGNHIANVIGNQVQVIVSTLENYPTNTTISRLRALGANITVKRKVVYLDDQEVTTR